MIRLRRAFEELNNIGYGSGKEFAQYLMDGMKSQEKCDHGAGTAHRQRGQSDH